MSTRRASSKPRTALTIIDACESATLFKPWFKNPATWQHWFVFLRALFGVPLDAEALAIYQRFTCRTAPPSTGFLEAWLIIGRRAGKSLILAITAVFLACFRDWSSYLSPGERGLIVIVATDRRQARIIYRYVRALLLNVPALAPLVEHEDDESIDLTNGISIAIMTCSFRSIRGYTIVAALLDEIAYWRNDESSAVPDTEVLDAIRPAMATVEGALLIAAGSPYARRGEQYKTYQRYHGKDDAPVLVWQAASRDMNPTLRQSIVDAAYERDAASAAAEYGGQFRDDVEAFITPEAVASATVSGRYELPPQASVDYVGFTDVASGSGGDSFASAVGHLDRATGHVVIDAVHETRPPFTPEITVAAHASFFARYRVHRIDADHWGGEWPREAFRKHGIEVAVSERVKSVIYSESLHRINSRTVELPDLSKVAAQLCALERKRARGGRDSIDHPPNGHDDLANCICGVIVAIETDTANALIRERDLVPTDPPATLGRVMEFYAVLWICGDGTAAWAIFAKPANTNKPLIIVDFERCSWHARMTDDIASQLDGLCENAGLGHAAASAWFYAPEALTRVADRSMCNVFAQRATRADAAFRRIAVEAISPKLLVDPMKLVFSAHARTGTGKVQLAASALAKTRTAPLFGALAVRPGERVDDDPLRVVLLVGIVSAFEVAR